MIAKYMQPNPEIPCNWVSNVVIIVPADVISMHNAGYKVMMALLLPINYFELCFADQTSFTFIEVGFRHLQS